MAENNAFFSNWTHPSPYWLIIEGASAAKLDGFTPVHHKPTLCAKKAESDWAESWHEAANALNQFTADHVGHRAAVIAGETLPELAEVNASLRPVREISGIANNLWLVHDVNHGRLGCYMQRVMDRRGKLVGYEAFARMEAADGGVVGGGAIMQAATALHVEYQIDRLLHKCAVESFVARDLEGYIFINFLTGFIQRPEVYLEGLSEAAKRTHVRPGAVVLDVPLADYARDLKKLQSIADYCRTRGFALALDDVMVADGLAPLLNDIRPAFVKLDGKFGTGMTEIKRQSQLREIIRLAHENGACVLAEGIEDQAAYDAYFAAGVDMFQGYLFGAPERHSPEKNQAKA